MFEKIAQKVFLASALPNNMTYWEPFAYVSDFTVSDDYPQPLRYDVCADERYAYMKPKFEGELIGHFSRRKIRDVMAFAAGHELHHVLSRFGSKGFEFELECDRRGAGHAVNAGFRPRGGPYFFEWRLERNRDSYTPGEIDSEQERILRLITVYRKILTQRDYNRFRDNIELPQARIEEIVTSQSAFAASQRTR